MKQDSRFEFKLDGQELALTSFAFTQSMDSLCGAFEAGLGGFHPAAMMEKVGKPVSIRVGEITRECLLDASSYSVRGELSISGRDRTSILVDSSAPTLNFPKLQTYLALAKRICEPFEIPVNDPKNLGGFLVKNLSVTPGDSAFEVLAETAVKGGIYLSTDDGRSLVIRPSEPRGESEYEIDDSSPVLAISVKKNLADVYGHYVGIKECSTSMFDKVQKFDHSDSVGHPLKRKIIVLKEGETPEKALVLEAFIRRRRSVSVDISLAGFVNLPLGTVVDLDVRGFQRAGVVTEIEYQTSPHEETTRIVLGGTHTPRVHKHGRMRAAKKSDRRVAP